MLGAPLERQPQKETSVTGETHHWQRGYSELKQIFLAKISICEYKLEITLLLCSRSCLSSAFFLPSQDTCWQHRLNMPKIIQCLMCSPIFFTYFSCSLKEYFLQQFFINMGSCALFFLYFSVTILVVIFLRWAVP